jgi:RNA polymerase-binding transcription factor DksA
MSKNENYQKLLDVELEKVTKDLNSIAKQDKESGDWYAVPAPESDAINADDNVGADISEDWNERRATVAQLELRYLNIKRALEKIANNEYGICEISGNPIETERLMANPAARTNLANLDREKELPV